MLMVLVPTVCHCCQLLLSEAAVDWRGLIARVCRADLEQGSQHITVINEAGGLIFCVEENWGVPGGHGEGEDRVRGAELPVLPAITHV